MAKAISYGWRLFATGFCFFSFGLSGLLLRFLVFPALSVLPGNHLQRISRGQRVVHYISYDPSTLTKAKQGYQIPYRRFHLTMHVGDDIALDEFTTIKPKAIAVRRFNQFLQDYFTRQREVYKQYGK